ncbi:MAG: hypothetical protein AAF127_06540 [Pseudomonadota bacterium]
MPFSRRIPRALAGASCLLAVGITLTACDSAGSGGGAAGGVTEGEARALDEAAKMLDEKRLPEGALPDVDPPQTEAAPEQSGAPETE